MCTHQINKNVCSFLFSAAIPRSAARRLVFAMAPKRVGGRGKKVVQALIAAMFTEGLNKVEIRAKLKSDGYKPARISQLFAAGTGADLEQMFLLVLPPGGPAPPHILRISKSKEGSNANSLIIFFS